MRADDLSPLLPLRDTSRLFRDSRARLAASAGALPAAPCRICAERVRISTCLRPAALWAWGGCEHPFLQPVWRLPRTSNSSPFSPVLSADLSRAGGYAVIKGVCCNILPLQLLLLGLVLLLLLPPARLSPGRAKVSWGSAMRRPRGFCVGSASGCFCEASGG